LDKGKIMLHYMMGSNTTRAAWTSEAVANSE